MNIVEVLHLIWLDAVRLFWDVVAHLLAAITDDTPMVRGHNAKKDHPDDWM